MNYLMNYLMIALMIFGFGFVVFFHELGHFLAAKWVGIKVEQFAVGFGQAMFAFRKGIGWRFGSTNKEYQRRIEEHLDRQQTTQLELKEKIAYTDDQLSRAASELGLGDTEYRLNWVPLGGYVKMLGQDDLKPGAIAEDPRAYNRKSISARMLVVSAGVIMNIILAAIGFMVLFLIGFKAPAATVGSLLAGSPAQKAGLQVGDRIIAINNHRQYDFTKIGLETALLKEGVYVDIDYERPGVSGVQHTSIRPERMGPDPKEFLTIGIRSGSVLLGLDPAETSEAEFKKLFDDGTMLPDFGRIRPGDTITAVNGEPVKIYQRFDTENDEWKLDRAIQSSGGRDVTITVKDAQGKIRDEKITPYLDHPFASDKGLSIAGLQPRPRVEQIADPTSVKGKLNAGDVIAALDPGDLQNHPDEHELKKLANGAYEKGRKLTVIVLRDGKTVSVEGIDPKTRTSKGMHGLGIGLGYEREPIVSIVIPDSPAKKAGIPDGARITEVDGEEVGNWFEVRDLLAQWEGAHTISAAAPLDKDPNTFEAVPQSYTIHLNAADVQELKNMRARYDLALREQDTLRITHNPLVATEWGIVETRDLVLQFYVTIKRMFQGSVSYTNMMGPLGIVQAGAKFASRGGDWLIWFLAMISANLAVVNFLPIPIVDGGLFTFLVLEKLQGKPLSQRTQAVAQIVGFALIISVFLLVTFQDLRRMTGMQ